MPRSWTGSALVTLLLGTLLSVGTTAAHAHGDGGDAEAQPSVTPVAASEAAARPGKVRVKLRVKERRIAPLHRVHLTGRVRGFHRGAKVRIIQKQSYRRVWRTEGFTRVRRHGVFRYTERVHRGSRTYRACVQVGGRRVCSRGHFVKMVRETHPRIRARVSAPGVMPGQAVTVSGRVSERASAGDRMMLRVANVDDYDFQPVAWLRLPRHRRFSVTVVPPGPGKWVYDLYKPATAVSSAAWSSNLRVSSGVITFSEFPVGRWLTTEYAGLGVVFDDDVYITEDTSSDDSPVLTGSPKFMGPIEGRFVGPGGVRATVSEFSFRLGYLNTAGSVEVEYFDVNGVELGSFNPYFEGFDTVTVSRPGIASFRVHIEYSEPAGFEIDDLRFSPPVAARGVPARGVPAPHARSARVASGSSR